MSPTILLVEDDENDVFLMQRAMQQAGVIEPLQIAWDGREALDYLQGGGKFGPREEFPLPSLVLLDLKLPYIMGLDVLRWIRHRDQFRSTVVIVLSASQSPADIEESYRLGADAFFVKPSALNQLLVVARAICDAWLKGHQASPRSPNSVGEFQSRTCASLDPRPAPFQR